jgi:uroporphyrinogen-III synthase
MNAPLVVNTRPMGQNNNFSKALEEKGFRVADMPLLIISPTGTEPPVGAAEAVGSIITSAHAAAPLSQLADFKAKPAYCVGKATASALREAGFRDIRVGDGNAALLADRIITENPPGPLLYPAATETAFDMAGVLTQRGIHCEIWPVYSTIEPDLRKWAADFAKLGKVDWVVLTSPRIARAFASVCPDPVDEVRLAVISQAVAETLPESWAPRIHISAEPNTGAVLHLVTKHR